MGAINYRTSDYITMGIRPTQAADLLADQDFREWIEEEYRFRPEDDTQEVRSLPTWRQYDREEGATV